MQQSLQILVAENNPDDAFFLRSAFEQAESDASVNFVQDGQELLDYLRGEPPFNNRIVYPLPNMLLLDLDLPCIDGLRFLAWLQKEPRMQELVVVVLSGSSASSDLERAFGLGALEYLVKPHNPQELVDVVRKLERLWYQLTTHSLPSVAEAMQKVG